MASSPVASEPRIGARERRKKPRKRVSLPATLTLERALVDALGTDVSAEGMRLVTSRPIPVGANVDVAFLLDGNMIAGRGEVRWCALTKNGLVAFGMVFTMLEDDGAAIIASFADVA